MDSIPPSALPSSASLSMPLIVFKIQNCLSARGKHGSPTTVPRFVGTKNFRLDVTLRKMLGFC
jgi:hypothetical protein